MRGNCQKSCRTYSSFFVSPCQSCREEGYFVLFSRGICACRCCVRKWALKRGGSAGRDGQGTARCTPFVMESWKLDSMELNKMKRQDSLGLYFPYLCCSIYPRKAFFFGDGLTDSFASHQRGASTSAFSNSNSRSLRNHPDESSPPDLCHNNKKQSAIGEQEQAPKADISCQPWTLLSSSLHQRENTWGGVG